MGLQCSTHSCFWYRTGWLFLVIFKICFIEIFFSSITYRSNILFLKPNNVLLVFITFNRKTFLSLPQIIFKNRIQVRLNNTFCAFLGCQPWTLLNRKQTKKKKQIKIWSILIIRTTVASLYTVVCTFVIRTKDEQYCHNIFSKVDLLVVSTFTYLLVSL